MIKEYFGHSTSSLKGSSLKGLSGAISSLEDSYCSTDEFVNITVPDPSLFSPTATRVVWEIVVSVAGNPENHDEWGEVINPGTVDAYLEFYPQRVAPQFRNDYDIWIGYSVLNAAGLPAGGSGFDTGNSDNTRVYKSPTIYNLTANATSICSGNSVVLTLNNSESGYAYQLLVDGSNATSSTDGVDGSPINWTVDVAGTYTVEVSRKTGSSCTNTMNGSPVLTVYNNPVLTTSGDVSICSGNSTIISATSDMDPDVTYTWDDGSGGSPEHTGASFDVSPTTTTTYTVRGTNNTTGCFSEEIIIVTVNTRPTVSLSGDATICNGTSADLTFDFTGTAPWTVIYNDGADQTFSTSDDPYILTVNPASTTSYSLVSVEDANSCFANASELSGSATVTVNERPTGVLSGNSTICNGGSTTIHFDLTGTGPWDVTYNDGTDHTITVNTASYDLVVSPTSTTTYSFTGLSDGNCTSNVGEYTGTATVTVIERPTGSISGDATICNGDNTDLTFTLTGVGPWDITYNDGTDHTVTANASPYYLTVSPSATTTYTITGLSDSQCTSNSGDLSGSAIVTVNPRPTGVVSGTTTICDGDVAQVSFTLTGTAPWSLIYNDGTDHVINNILSSPHIITVSPTVTTTYNLVSLSDNNGCDAQNGEMTGSAVVSVNERPTAIISGNETICNGDNANLTINFTGTAPWNLTYNDGSDHVINGINVASYNLVVSPTSNATYVISALSDANCTAVPSDLTGSGTVTVNARPTGIVSGDATICNGDNTNISFTFTGVGPWDLTYNDGTSDIIVNNINTNPYIVNVSPSTTSVYSIVALSDQLCTSINSDFSGPATVTVNERPTGVVSGNATICDGESTDITFTLTGSSPWDLTYNDGTDHTVTVNSSPYVLSVSPSTTTAYQITSLADASLCSSQASEITGLVTINVNPRPQASISGDNSICIGETTDLTFNLIGTGPWNITYNDGTTDYTINNITNSTHVETITTSASATYVVVGLSDALCTSQSSDLTGSASVTVNQVTANLSVSAPSPGATTVCAGVDVTFNAAATDGTGNYSYNFHLIRGGVDQSVHSGSATYTTPDLQNGDQIYVVATDNTTSCTDNSDIIAMTINANPVPVLSITSAGGNEVCFGTPVDFVASSGFDRYIFYRNGTEVLQDGTSNTLITTVLENGNTVNVVAYEGDCFGASTSITMNIHDLPAITLVSDKTTVCENEVVTFTASGSGSGSLTYQFVVNGNPQGSQSATNTFTWSATNDFDVEAIVFDSFNCELTSETIHVTISKPVATLISDKTLICENEDITFTAGGGDNYEFFIDGVSVQGPGINNEYISNTLENNDNVTVQVTDAYGCVATHSGISITVNPVPVVSLSSSDIDNTICANDEVTFTATGGDVYEFFVDGVSVQGPGGNDEYITTSLSDGEEVTAIVSYSTSGCSATTSGITTTVNPLPTPTLTIAPSNSFISGTNVTLTAGGGTEYEYFINSTVSQSRDVNNIYSSNSFVDNDIVTVDVYDINNCMSSIDTIMHVFDNIVLLDVLSTEPSYCEGGTGVSVYVGGVPQDGVTYELIRGSDNSIVGSSIMFSSSNPIDVRWDNITGTEEYRVEAYYTSVPGVRFEMNNRVTITEYSLPTIYNLTPTGSVTGCNGGAGHVISLDNSQSDVEYTLLLDDAPVEVLIGSDGSQLDFSAQLGIGTYTIIAQNINSGCQRYMAGTFAIVGDGSDVPFGVYVINPANPSDITDGRYCEGQAGVEIGLDGSLDNSVTYKLFLDGNDTGISAVGNNGAITFGTIAAEGTYTVRVESASGCQFPMTGYADVSVISNPTAYNVVADNNGHYCAGDAGVSISIDNQEQGVDYSLYLNSTTLIETITGTDAVGTPLVFTGLQNTAGVYSVQARVPDVDCTTDMVNTVEVQVDALPTVFDLTSDGDYCSGSSTYINMSGSESNVNYSLHNLDDDSYGASVAGTGGVLQLEVTASGNYEVVAQRNDGVTSCQSIMNGTFVITEKPLPEDRFISETYNGTGCDDGSIVTVIMSQSGVQYTLVKKVGANYYDAGLPSIMGDGNDIDFAPIVDKDNAEYTAMATLDGCSIYLSGSVFIDIAGVLTKQVVTGEGEICNGDPGVIFGLNDTESGVTYELWLSHKYGVSGESAEEVIVGNGSAMDFPTVNNEGEYLVIGTSASCTIEMANRVVLNVNPLPEAYRMIGSGEFCDMADGAEISLDNSEEGVSYMLQYDNGTILGDALSTPAIGGAATDTITFGKFTDIGTYTVIATTDKGCTSSMNGFVITQLSPAPVNQLIEFDNDLYCESDAGVEFRLTDHEPNVVYQVIDETSNSVVAEVSDSDPAASGVLSLGMFTEGTYSFVASRGGDACEISINNGTSVTLASVPQPTSHAVYADATNVCGSVGTNVGITDSEAGRTYRLEDSTGPIQDAIASVSGEAISWAVADIGTSEIYEIYAEADGGCDLLMGTVEVNFKDAPALPDYELSSNEYCEGEDGISIVIHNTEPDRGYQLKNIDGTTVGFDDGNGGDILFENIQEGEYYIIARNYESGCATYSFENFTIVMNPTPNVEILQIGNLDCTEMCYGLTSSDEIILDNSAPEEDLTVYSLLLNGLDIQPETVDSVGRGRAINYGSRADAGIYTVRATSIKGCTSIMDGTVYLEEFPLNAEDDYLILTKGENAGTIIVAGQDETVNDTWNVSIDFLGDPETGNNGNLRFWFDRQGGTSTDISSGSVTIDEISSVLVYTKKPGFFGKDSVQYFFKNTDYLAPRERIDSAWVHIFVGNKDLDAENAFIIPNAFSPNGDGINDYFRISGIEEAGIYTAEKSKLEVFNRWGALVYRSTGDTYGEDDEWWDGTSTTANMVSIGTDLPNGTYFYVYTVEVNLATEETVQVKEYSGYIELRR
ncbi:gliding motility-associated C-terminal domain-containing protein [Plebeiibacterium sediminum]|uniref:Gliding motility-associated C-terminal domain-containing protein n=1 Tax=Plebeiibacterium sediminum TaxID=2992112 RepID=A0AAE3SFF7_9BACT|nr:gliding motility-associated C-terminal domain-containing protein [Plebeiobacterium sediminum]MCW3787037.1 gliding motility-associated C-terminal domain-containing protein [Plebeiobacterium sediminum]